MITFKEYFELVMEMARPAKSFADPMMNQAYSESLKKFKELGVNFANTYIIWDFIYKQLPPFFQSPAFLEAKKKASGAHQRDLVLYLFKKYPDEVDFNQLAIDINDVSKIRTYINREERGNRHKGLLKQRANQSNIQF